MPNQPNDVRVSLCQIIAAMLVLSACSGPGTGDGATAGAPPASAGTTATAQEEEPLPPLEYEAALPAGTLSVIDVPFTGDFDEMVKRRVIRAGVTFNRTFYFVDKGVQRGISYEHLKRFEEVVNTKHKTGTLTAHVVFVPLPRDQLLRALVDGRVDVVAAQLTVTPEREALVDFSAPTRSNVNEVVVTGPGAPEIKTVEDLAGKEVFARKSSSYYQSLVALNAQLQSKGLKPIAIQEAPENLEDDDLLEMVNAGLIGIVVSDDYMADFWAKIFSDITVHHDVAVRRGGALAVAFRKNSPKLAAETNEFIKKYGLGQAFGNVIEKRYLQSTSYATRSTSAAERKKFEALVELFRKYSDQYDLDYLLMAAQGYQESKLDQNAKSHVGAIGVMQVMPATGKDLNVGDITQLEPNVHAGVKYMRFMIDQYFKDEPMDRLNKGLFTFASYNAGPGRIRQLRREAARRGLDSNVWFGNVERVVSERIGRETVTYVSNIYKYYIAYRLAMAEMDRREAARSQIRQGTKP